MQYQQPVLIFTNPTKVGFFLLFVKFIILSKLFGLSLMWAFPVHFSSLHRAPAFPGPRATYNICNNLWQSTSWLHRLWSFSWRDHVNQKIVFSCVFGYSIFFISLCPYLYLIKVRTSFTSYKGIKYICWNHVAYRPVRCFKQRRPVKESVTHATIALLQSRYNICTLLLLFLIGYLVLWAGSKDWAKCFCLQYCLVGSMFYARTRTFHICWTRLMIFTSRLLSLLNLGFSILHHAGCLFIPVMLVDKRWVCEFCLKRLRASRL